MCKKLILTGFYTVLMLASNSLLAKVLWQDFSVTYLSGQNYEIGDPDRQVITLEHVAGTSWGDSFMFLDHLRSSNGDRSNYAEWSPRISLCKTGISCISNAFIKDVLIASTIEMSSASTDFLYGVGFDLNIPQFQFVQLNFYRRNNDNNQDNWQVTSAWALPFEIADQPFRYDGFIDWFNSTDDQRSSFNWTSQLKWSASKWLGLSSPLYFGIEYVFWRNKYGIANSAQFDTNESNVNLLVKWHF